MRHFLFQPLLLLALAGCSKTPDDPPDYGKDTGSIDSGPDANFYTGVEAYTEGTPRLSIGLFYEGGSSETVEVDGISTHYYIYSDEHSGEATYTTYEDTDDRIEGYLSDVIVHTGGAWWGGGVHWDSSHDLSTWSQLNLSIQTIDSGFIGTNLAMQSQNGAEGRVSLQAYGFLADGEWHNLQIPTADLQTQGLNLAAVIAPFILVAEGGSNGAEMRIDDVYFSSP
jgi:hypothetical protein